MEQQQDAGLLGASSGEDIDDKNASSGMVINDNESYNADESELIIANGDDMNEWGGGGTSPCCCW